MSSHIAIFERSGAIRLTHRRSEFVSTQQTSSIDMLFVAFTLNARLRYLQFGSSRMTGATIFLG